MKLQSFSIQNFKSLENISVTECTDFHALVGANSTGKTSIFDALEITQQISKRFTQKHWITKGLKDYDSKFIVVDLNIKLDNDERRDYLKRSFHIVSDVDTILTTNVLKDIHLQITVNCYGSKIVNQIYPFQVIPSLFEISSDDGNIPIMKTTNQRQLQMKSRITPNTDRGQYLGSCSGWLNHLEMIEVIANDYMNTDLFSGRFLSDLQTNLRYIEAIRETHKKVFSEYLADETQIGQHGEKLSNLMETFWSNENDRYLEIERFCKSIFPNIKEIRPHKLPDNEIVIQIRKKNIDVPIMLDSEGRGLDQVLVVIWKIAASPANTIWLVDEPEIHLHPGAQKLLYQFFQDEISQNKQIIVSTHSMIFIHRCQEKQISILLYKDGITELSSLENIVNAESEDEPDRDRARSIVYDALGYDSSQSFEYLTIVVVEGKTDELLLKIFAEILEKPIDEKTVKFIPVGNKDDVKRFAPILKYAVSKRIIVVLDNDNQDPEQIKQAIKSKEKTYKDKTGITRSLLRDKDFCFYNKEAYSIESYLLSAEAIGKAGKLSSEQVEQIRAMLHDDSVKSKKEREKPKELLSNIWSYFGLGQYDDDSLIRIAKNITSLHLSHFPEISQIIGKINGN